MDENAKRGAIIGGIIALLGVGGVGLAFYAKQNDYVPVVAVVSKVEMRCFRHLDAGDNHKLTTFVPSDERKCPAGFAGMTQHDDDFWQIARLNFVTYRYVSPIDGKTYEGVIRRSGYVDVSDMAVGKPINIRTHKAKPAESVVDGVVPV
jgi:hypothetical protein